MPKLLFAILLVISAFSVLAHSVLVYQVPTTQATIAGEEVPDENTHVKEGKALAHDKSFLSFDFRQYSRECQLPKQLSDFFVNSKGFFDKPYNPPEAG